MLNTSIEFLTIWEDLPHPEVARGQPDDGGLVQLRRDGCGEGEELPQLEELRVLLLPAVAGGVLALVLLCHREAEGIDIVNADIH